MLNEVEARQMLGAAGIGVTDTRLAASREEVIILSKKIGLIRYYIRRGG